VTLPDVSSVPVGKTYRIKDLAKFAWQATLRVVPQVWQTIDWLSSFIFTMPWEAIEVIKIWSQRAIY
jgi:hypothetical protein